MNIAFYNNKGGVGKTTIASACVYMAKQYNIQTNIIDADKQRNLIQLVSGGNWSGGEIYEDGCLTVFTSFLGYDPNRLCIFDCPPEFDFIEKMADIPIDLWVIPIQGRFSIDGAASVCSQLKINGRENEKILILSNKNIRQGKYGREQFKEAQKLGAELYPKPIYENVIFQKAEDSLKYVFDMPYACRSEAVETLKNFADEVVNGRF